MARINNWKIIPNRKEMEISLGKGYIEYYNEKKDLSILVYPDFSQHYGEWKTYIGKTNGKQYNTKTSGTEIYDKYYYSKTKADAKKKAIELMNENK